jgi:hypothetical protein
MVLHLRLDTAGSMERAKKGTEDEKPFHDVMRRIVTRMNANPVLEGLFIHEAIDYESGLLGVS